MAPAEAFVDDHQRPASDPTPAVRVATRFFDRSDEPDSDDASDVYVIEVFGVSVLIMGA